MKDYHTLHSLTWKEGGKSARIRRASFSPNFAHACLSRLPIICSTHSNGKLGSNAMGNFKVFRTKLTWRRGGPLVLICVSSGTGKRNISGLMTTFWRENPFRLRWRNQCSVSAAIWRNFLTSPIIKSAICI